ncbi:MAG: XRE family transcriptional regulator [Chitinophagaceae bacterium]|nr:MAG: XRE family transcriptional regulator [Chitinophagaceae bacterium]
MKSSKKIKLLRGITAFRIVAGMTQQVFAQQLGVSKSLISMVENGKRKLPTPALLKLSRLEIKYHADINASRAASDQQSCPFDDRPLKNISDAAERSKIIRVQELKYELIKVRHRQQEMNTAARILNELIPAAIADNDRGAELALKMQAAILQVKQPLFNSIVQQKIEARIARIAIELSLKSEPGAVHLLKNVAPIGQVPIAAQLARSVA